MAWRPRAWGPGGLEDLKAWRPGGLDAPKNMEILINVEISRLLGPPSRTATLEPKVHFEV